VTWDYTFNIFNKLTKLEKTKLGVKTECGFKYGADGYRVEKELAGGAGVSPVRRLYILDGVHVILEKEIVGEGEPVTKVRYIPGVCMITRDDEDEPVIRYYHEDALGSFIAMTDENQNLTALYQSDAWGNELLTQVSALSPPPSENPYRWCGTWGYYRDPDAQMYLLGMRWYDPQTGRFVSRDPIGLEGEYTNFLRYVSNGPPNLVDPLGQAHANVWDPTSDLIPSGAGSTGGGGAGGLVLGGAAILIALGWVAAMAWAEQRRIPKPDKLDNGRFLCYVRCSVIHYGADPDTNCPSPLHGWGAGPSERVACYVAQMVAKSMIQFPHRCRARHCKTIMEWKK
jgi:RHS repeat-associated protein